MGHLLQVGQGEGQWTEILLEYVQEEDKEAASNIINALQSNPQPFDETLRLQLEQGLKVIRVKGTVVPGADGSPAKVLGVNWDITEMQCLEDENLRIKLDQQKELALAILNTQDAERRRIAEALHNGIAQLLYAAKLNLGQVLGDENITSTPPLAESVSKADGILEKAIQQTRSLSHELIPTPLSNLGLDAAIKDICSTFNSPQLKLRCWLFNLNTPLDKHLELVVYHIAQELVNNVVKHAQATEAGIILREQRGALVLEVEDNSIGFLPNQLDSRGIGLKSIRGRINLLNGTMEIDSALGQGTPVTIYLPLPKTQAKP
ncbi:sensor histidine kinase [Rufibacter tibetensis]|uniref:Oxygen sensor histidine kinase NreB n=1 Tax=Rufibacter tibetensis TaxID=512763 RepID=A0A0P0CT16_9BACT|nr:PAS domain-containing sensor histidine kinase [Rufibacter tibetensis]ALI99699.1 hypothetical protein DC20_12845 [Rufibacter tibetensis]